MAPPDGCLFMIVLHRIGSLRDPLPGGRNFRKPPR
jgi:hypothetical protein